MTWKKAGCLTCMALVLASSTGSLASPASPGIPSRRPCCSKPGHNRLTQHPASHHQFSHSLSHPIETLSLLLTANVLQRRSAPPMVTTGYLPIDPTPTTVFQLSERGKSKLDL